MVSVDVSIEDIIDESQSESARDDIRDALDITGSLFSLADLDKEHLGVAERTIDTSFISCIRNLRDL